MWPESWANSHVQFVAPSSFLVGRPSQSRSDSFLMGTHRKRRAHKSALEYNRSEHHSQLVNISFAHRGFRL